MSPPSDDEVEHGPLNDEGFPCFSKLLAACQPYAARSGCRLHCGALSESSDEELDTTTSSNGHCVWSMRLGKAASVARDFGQRLKMGDAGLVAELEQAAFACNDEVVRKNIIAACQAYELWPPLPTPIGVDPGDLAYENTLAPLDVIAQRAYNYTVAQEFGLLATGPYSHLCPMTCSFLLDFANDAGVPEPQMTSTHRKILSDLNARVMEWEAKVSPSGSQRCLSSSHRTSRCCFVSQDNIRSSVPTATTSYHLMVDVLAVSDLVLPRSRKITRALSGPDSLHAELQVGDITRKTREIEAIPGQQSTDFNERMIFTIKSCENSLDVRVKSGTILCGHPCIGKATLPLGADLHDSEIRLLQIHLDCDGNSAGKILLQYRMLPTLA